MDEDHSPDEPDRECRFKTLLAVSALTLVSLLMSYALGWRFSD